MQNGSSSYGNRYSEPRSKVNECSVLKSPISDACCNSAYSGYPLEDTASKLYEDYLKMMNLVGPPQAREMVNEDDIDWKLPPNSENVEVLDGRSEEGKGLKDLEEEADWGYWPRFQLEDLLLKNLEFLYKESISTIVSIGYSVDVALKAVLKNGHCYGSEDVLSNIVQNSLAYLSGSNSGCHSSDIVFTDLDQLEEYVLAEMVCLIQQVRPHLSKGDAMWCLLMSNLDVDQASTLDIPPLSLQCGGMATGQSTTDGSVVKPGAQINVASFENSNPALHANIIDMPSPMKPCLSSFMPLELFESAASHPSRTVTGCNFMDTSWTQAREMVNEDDIDWKLPPNSENVEVLDGRSEEGKGLKDLEEEADWRYWTKFQLEDLLLKNLEFLYKESISTIVSIGYSVDVALKAVLKNGHCY